MSTQASIFLYVFFGSIDAMVIILTWMAVSSFRRNRKAEREEEMRRLLEK